MNNEIRIAIVTRSSEIITVIWSKASREKHIYDGIIFEEKYLKKENGSYYYCKPLQELSDGSWEIVDQKINFNGDLRVENSNINRSCMQEGIGRFKYYDLGLRRLGSVSEVNIGSVLINSEEDVWINLPDGKLDESPWIVTCSGFARD